MRILVTGRTGQVATALCERAAFHPGVEVIAVGRPELDLERPDSIASAIRAAEPDVVVNAAAFTTVDLAENQPERAFAVNRDGAGTVAAAAARCGADLIHLSTDYVFSGDTNMPYRETDATGPACVYGHSKLQGELAVRAAHPGAVILRTSWVFSPFGQNFLKTMLRIGRERPDVRVVNDQHGNPTSALDLADAILRIAPSLAGAAGGTYHLSGEGGTTWFGFAQQIFAASAALGGPHPVLVPVTTSDYPTAARRPADSRLSSAAFRARYGFGVGPWEDAVAATVRRLVTAP